MERYKLIEEYAGSPKLGFILDDSWKIEQGAGNHATHYVNQIAFNPKHYPKQWERIIEKDYEILSFTKVDSNCVPKDGIGTLFYLQENGLFSSIHKHSYRTEIQLLEGGCSVRTGFFAINSVKRLSDGEIFTIGDNTKYGCIDKFYIKNNYLLSTTVLESNGRYLKYLEKIKQPLFTTEDGVDIFNPTLLWRVSKSSFYFNKYGDYMIQKGSCAYLCFSTKEKAEEYILMNKPFL